MRICVADRVHLEVDSSDQGKNQLFPDENLIGRQLSGALVPLTNRFVHDYNLRIKATTEAAK